MKDKMPRVFVAGLLSLLALPAAAQEAQVRHQALYITLQVAQGRNQYVSAALKVGVAENDAGFFEASGFRTGDYIQIRGKSYVIGRTGTTITLREKDSPGRFLSCCRQDGLQLVLRGTPAASEHFVFQTYTEKGKQMAQARKAAAGNTGAASADSAIDPERDDEVLDGPARR